MLKMMGKNKYVLAITICITLAIVFAYFYTQSNALVKFDPKVVLSQVNQTDTINDFLEIEKMISDNIKLYGTKAGFEIIDEGERQGLISNDACHGLLHYVGHTAYAENPADYKALLEVVEGTNCIGGYLHGIEAEIVLGSSNVIEDVQKFCLFQKEQGVNPGPCYHGVGHATTELYKYDVPKSLALCDALENDAIENDLTNCYRGVFSEVGNIVTGHDGHTGLEIDSIPIDGLNEKDPYTYCEKLSPRHRSSCKSQLTKVATMDLNIEDWLTTCKDSQLSQSSRDICININTGVYVRHRLSFATTTLLPSHIYDFTPDEQKIAILGSAEAFAGYLSDGAEKDWRSFCNSIEFASTKKYCFEIFNRMINKNEAPWMDRTDIR